MENASKALIIAGAILLSILIIGIGMYIYTNSHGAIDDSATQMSEQEKTSFNQQWNTYEGKQGGNVVKQVLQKLIANCNTNAQEASRLVGVTCKPTTSSSDYKLSIKVGEPTANFAFDDGRDTYEDVTPEDAVKVLTGIRNMIETRHTYTVTISYSSSTSLVDEIQIAYD